MDYSTTPTQVKNYLSLLDNKENKYIWQIIGEREGVDLAPQNFCATLEKAYPVLVEANQAGYAIYVTINESKTDRRKATDICRVRAVFVELDRGDITEEDLKGLIEEYKVSFAVWSSPGKCHLYWRLADGVCAVDKFSSLQSVLQYKFKDWKAGRESKDLPRILRVPGFYHQKKEPFLSRLVVGTRFNWTSLEQLLDEIGIDDSIIEKAHSENYFPVDAFTKLSENPAVDGQKFVGTDSGNRNDALFNYCYQTYFVTKGLDLEDATVLALMHNKKNSPPLKDKEVIQVVKSAYTRFLEQGGISIVDGRVAVANVVSANSCGVGESDGYVPTPVKYDFSLTEMYPPNSQLSIASRIEQRFHNKIKYNRERGFYANTNGVWINSRDIQSKIIAYITYITNELESEPEFRNCFVDDNMTFKRTQMNHYIRDIHSASGLRNIKSLMESRAMIYEATDNFETQKDAHLLACSNGVINLLTGEKVEGEELEKSRLVYGIETPFYKGSKCHTWERFILSCMNGDVDSVEYVQKVCGYLLSGDTNLKSMFLIYGIPGTGKSIFLNVLSKLMGEYATELPPSLFLDKGADNMSMSMLAQAQYCRMCTVMELDEKDKWGKSIIKALTGEDYITCKLMRQDGFRYKPRFKLCIRANEMPHTDSLDQAIWERLKFLPFNVKFRGTDQEDTRLEQKLLEELPGILRWAQLGYAKLIETGFECPKSILASTKVIRLDCNSIDLFLEECLEVKKGWKIPMKDLYKSYDHWCTINDHKKSGRTRFERYLLHKELIKLEEGSKKILKGWIVKEEVRVNNGVNIFDMI